MKRILRQLAQRKGYDGWAVVKAGETEIMPDSFWPTRQQARDFRAELQRVEQGDMANQQELFHRPPALQVVKVRIKLERAEG